jgi:hypothetical protein
MPIVVATDFPSVSPELYVKIHTYVMGGGRPNGMISHCCVNKNDGISVVDIWESRKKFETFAEEKLAAALKNYGIEGGPENLRITELINADAFEYRGAVLSD